MSRFLHEVLEDRGFKIRHVYFPVHHWGRTASIAIKRPTNRAVTAKTLEKAGAKKFLNQRSIVIFFISFFKCHQIAGNTDHESHISGVGASKPHFEVLRLASMVAV